VRHPHTRWRPQLQPRAGCTRLVVAQSAPCHCSNGDRFRRSIGLPSPMPFSGGITCSCPATARTSRCLPDASSRSSTSRPG